MNPSIAHLPRPQRRHLLRNEEVARRSGEWGPWERLTFPRRSAGSGFAADFTVAHRNAVFCVLDRTLPDGTRHLAVSSLSGVRPSWHEMQRIKNDLAGGDATGVEVYPPAVEVVDGADMFHLWILPAALPFSLHRERSS